MSKEITDAKRRAIKKYDAANTKQLHLKLNLKTDADIIEHLGRQESVQGYIKALIREDMTIRFFTRKEQNNPYSDIMELSFPAVDGYRDEDAIRECQEKNHRMYTPIVYNWEVLIDLDAKKVLTVKDVSGISIPGHRRIL